LAGVNIQQHHCREAGKCKCTSLHASQSWQSRCIQDAGGPTRQCIRAQPHERLPRRSTSSRRNLQRTPAAPLGAQTEARSNRLRHVQTRNTMLANSTFNFPIFSFTAGSTVPTVLSVNTPPIILLGPRRVREAGAAVWPAGGPQQARLAGPAYASTLKTRCGRVLRRRPRCVRGALTVMQSPIALPIRVELCQRFSDEAVLMALLV